MVKAPRAPKPIEGAPAEPDRCAVLDATVSADMLAERIWQCVDDRLSLPANS